MSIYYKNRARNPKQKWMHVLYLDTFKKLKLAHKQLHSTATNSNEVINENILIVWEAKDHSGLAAHTCFQKLIDKTVEKISHLEQSCSGCVFYLTKIFPSNFSMLCYYSKRHHGKGPMDGAGGCVEMLFTELKWFFKR